MTYPYWPGQPEPMPPPADPPVPGYGPAYYHPQQVYPYGYQPPRPTEGLAIASLVVSCASVLGVCAYGVGGLLGIVGAIPGHVARHRITRIGFDGAGMALAGIVVGWVMTAVAVGAAALVITLIVTDPSIN